MINRYFISFFILFLSFMAFGSVLAQDITVTETLKKTAEQAGIAFPVTDLGNCASVTECRNYCEEPENKAACIAYAKSRGFYREDGNKVSAVNKAMTELRCSTVEQCRAFCQKTENRERCIAFAKKNSLKKEVKLEEKTLLERAKQILDCDSVGSCKAKCQMEENREQCSKFAKENKLKGGLREDTSQRRVASAEGDLRRMEERLRPEGEAIEKELRDDSQELRNTEKRMEQRLPTGKEIRKDTPRKNLVEPTKALDEKAPLLDNVKGISTVYSWWQRFVDFVNSQ